MFIINRKTTIEMVLSLHWAFEFHHYCNARYLQYRGNYPCGLLNWPNLNPFEPQAMTNISRVKLLDIVMRVYGFHTMFITRIADLKISPTILRLYHGTLRKMSFGTTKDPLMWNYTRLHAEARSTVTATFRTYLLQEYFVYLVALTRIWDTHCI
jgi:hypothetical protein